MARLDDIDTSTVEELERLREEQNVLAERLAKLEAERENVSDAVYERVSQDYRSQREALEEQAAPLREKTEEEFAKVRGILKKLRGATEKIRLEKEELEVRFRLGEFGEEEFQRNVGICEEELAQGEEIIAKAEVVGNRFVEALEEAKTDEDTPTEDDDPDESADGDTENGDTQGDDTGKSSGEDAEDSDEPSESDEDHSEEAEVPESSTDEPEAAMPEADAEDLVRPESPFDETLPGADHALGADRSIADSIDLDATMTTAAAAATRPVPDPDREKRSDFGSAAVPRLINDRSDEVIPLNLEKVRIGRAIANEIRLVSGAVSRHHAEVVLGEVGYEIHDLGSENGTWVNNVRVDGIRQLADHDIIQIGTEVLTYREG